MSKGGLHIYTHEFFPKKGGIAQYCHEFARAASSMGYSVTIHAPKSANPTKGDAEYAVMPGRAAGNHGFTSILKTRRRLIKNLENAPDAIHLLAEPGPLIALGSLSEKQIRQSNLIAILHGSEINRWSGTSLTRLLGIRALRNARSIRTVSGPICDLTLRSFPEFKAKLTAVPNALPSDFRRKAVKQVSPLTNETPGFRILSVGRIHRRKGFDQVIQAIGHFGENLKQHIHYTVAGSRKDARYLDELRALAKQKDVQLNIKLDLSNEALAECYEAADLFALTSRPHKGSVEGFGLVYLEAGAHGLPCIGYNRGGVSDAIQDGTTGLLVEEGNIEHLAQAIRRLHDDPDLRHELGQNNYTFATARTWTDVVTETLEGAL